MPAVLSEELVAFAQSGVVIHVGSADAGMRPETARAMGARVEPGGAEVTLFVPRASIGATEANLAVSGRVAAVFVRPLDDVSFQLKGTVVAMGDAAESDRALVDGYAELLLEQFLVVGIPARITRAIARWPALAVRFRVEQVFVQTPGPGAGAVLGPPSAGSGA